MLESLSNSITKIFDKFQTKKFIQESDLDQVLREIRIALLESDVSLPVAKKFIEKVRVDALGQEVIKSVSASNMVVKIVNDNLVQLLGSEKSEINLSSKSVIMLVGLQGAGKTTTAGKLALLIKNKHKKSVLLASLDTSRPAAAAQLEILSKKIGCDISEFDASLTPATLAKRAVSKLNNSANDILILDTAGRTQMNQELMDQLIEVSGVSSPQEILLVADSLTGQDAVNIAGGFAKALKLTGVILTRADADARFGAALTMREETGCPIKLIGVGEKIEDLEEFSPERIASRILGMGDILSLVELAQDKIDEKEAKKTEQKLREGKFDFDDMLKQIRNMRKLGGVSKMLSLLPSSMLGNAASIIGEKSGTIEKEIKKQEAIILSMTQKERAKPEILNSSRKRRIAKGCGFDDNTGVQEVNRLLKKYKQMQKMLGKVSGAQMQNLMQ